MKPYVSIIFIWYTHSHVMKEKLDHWLDFFENFYQQYTIMPTEYSNFSTLEDNGYIAVMTFTGFINKEDKTSCYFNATIQL